ncbi:MAG: T9SS type A sorting domain-containing protein [Parafilimonas sp.]|nr:T9SS type A sorting domain-containing protein [Parafilimonas sp.]
MKKLCSAISLCLLFVLKGYSFTQIVTVQNHVFTPSSFTINLGDTVKWTWINGSHTTTSLTIPAGATAWNQNMNSGSTTFIYVPKVLGVYNYKCTPHQSIGMVGNFTVVCPNASAQISANSATTFCKGGSVLLKSSVSANITSFQWKKNGANISGATSSTFTATTTGSYTLSVTNNCGNSNTSNAIKVTVNALPAATITPSGTVDFCPPDSVVLQANTGAGLTYQWTKNNVNINGATSPTFTATQGGSYRVIVTKTSTGCSKQSPVTKVVKQCGSIASTIQQDDNNSIKVYPNPSSNDFHVLLPSFNNEELNLSIFDESGNLIGIHKISSQEFSFGNELKQGIYLIQIKNGSTTLYKQKVTKE